MRTIKFKIRFQKLTNYKVKDFFFRLRIGFVDDEEKKREETQKAINKYLTPEKTEELMDLLDN